MLAEFAGEDRRPQPDHSLGKNRPQFNFDSALDTAAFGVGVHLDLPHRPPNLALREDPAANHYQALDIAQPSAAGSRVGDYRSFSPRKTPGQKNAGDAWSGRGIAHP